MFLSIRSILFLLCAIFGLLGCYGKYHSTSLASSDRLAVALGKNLRQQLLDIVWVEVYPGERSTLSRYLGVEEAAKVLQLLNNSENYIWDRHKRAVFIPAYTLRLKSSSLGCLEVAFSHLARQVRFVKEDGSLLVIDCDPMAERLHLVSKKL